MRPFGLQPTLEPTQHGGRPAGGRGHQEVVRRQTGGDPVVEHHPVFFQHQAVAAAADLELGERVAVDEVQKLRRVRALDVDLAQRRAVQHADGLARGLALAGDRRVQVLPGLGIVPGPLPLPDILELGAMRHVPLVHGRLAHRIEERADLAAGDGAEGDRRVVRAEGRGAGRGNVLAQGLRQDAHAVDIAELALVGAEAHRGVALDVLDRAEALARRQHNVGGGDVVLLVDELLRPVARPLPGRHQPHRQERRFGHGLDRRRGRRAAVAEAGSGSGLGPGGKPALEAVVKREASGAGTGRALGLERAAGNEAGLLRVPARLAAGLGEKMDGRVPAAGHRHEITKKAVLLCR